MTTIEYFIPGTGKIERYEGVGKIEADIGNLEDKVLNVYAYIETIDAYIDIIIRHDENARPFIQLGFVNYVINDGQIFLDYENGVYLEQLSGDIFLLLLATYGGDLVSLSEDITERLQDDIQNDSIDIDQIQEDTDDGDLVIIYDEEDITKIIQEGGLSKVDVRDLYDLLDFFIKNDQSDVTDLIQTHVFATRTIKNS